MSLTRKMLKALGLEEDKIEQIIDAHSETVEGLKSTINDLTTKLEGLPTVTKERDKLQAKLTELEAKAPDAAKVQADFDAFKAQIETEKANTQKATLLQQALLAAGVTRESAQKALLKVIDLSTVTLTEDGKLSSVDSLVTQLKTEYADFFTTTETGGTPPVNPPGNPGGKITREAFQKMTLFAQMTYLKDHPEEAKALTGK